MFYIIIILSGVFVYTAIISTLGAKAQRLEMIKKRIEKSKKINKNYADEFYENIPFFERIIKPFVDWLVISVANFIPREKDEKEKEQSQKKLVQAGIKMKAREYNTMRIIIIVLSGFVLGIFKAFRSVEFSLVSILMNFMIGCVLAYMFLLFVLTMRTRHRKEKMERQFPEFLDLLSVCIEGGLGFDQAVQYVVKEYKSELSDEFRIVLRDISLGSPRKDALLKLQDRCLVEQLKTFNTAVIQADEMGISLKKILMAQAYNTRQVRRQKVEEKVQKLPVKILIPMLIFIFPVIFIVLLTPVFINSVAILGGGI